ncbi:MAG: hypothetical protein Roseis2KO_31060 [Roseivirga sp.]
MSDMHENIDLFDAYQGKNLSAQELRAFETKLTEDASFNRAYQEYQSQLNLIKAMSAGEEMRSFMEAEEKPNKAKRRYLIPLGVAAALLLFFFVFSPGKQATGPELFDEYFEVFPDAVTGRSAASEINKGMALYESGQYEKAIEALSQLTPNDTTHFYKGQSFLALKNADKALSELNQMEMTVFSESVIWYKGLSFLLLEERDSASVYLSRAAGASVYQVPASELLKKLKSE